ncbi:MAG: prepilin-type N-terminal cleavage/methylation domain-containing protein, partial [Planctomycetota bacterium]
MSLNMRVPARLPSAVGSRSTPMQNDRRGGREEKDRTHLSPGSQEELGMPTRKPNPRGFTLIELLVVVAIIALLISILLPSLTEAREQARVAKCSSNMKSIMTATQLYLSDAKGRQDLPWLLPAGYTVGDKTYDWTYFTEFIWGGGMPDKTNTDWANSGLNEANGGTGFANMDTYNVQPAHRPLNAYFAAEVTWDRLKKDRTKYPADIPGFFQCPSDRTALVPTVGEDNPKPDPDTPFRCWEWWGSSYPINWYWPYYYGNSGAFIGNALTRGKDMMAAKTGRFASEFITFYEDQANYALEGARPPGYTSGGPWGSKTKQLVGWHGKKNRHVVGMLDGH